MKILVTYIIILSFFATKFIYIYIYTYINLFYFILFYYFIAKLTKFILDVPYVP